MPYSIFIQLACLNQIIPVLIDWKYWFTRSQLEIKFDRFALVPQDTYHQILVGNSIFREGKNGNNQMDFVGMSDQWMSVRNVNTFLFPHRSSGNCCSVL